MCTAGAKQQQKTGRNNHPPKSYVCYARHNCNFASRLLLFKFQQFCCNENTRETVARNEEAIWTNVHVDAIEPKRLTGYTKRHVCFNSVKINFDANINHSVDWQAECDRLSPNSRNSLSMPRCPCPSGYHFILKCRMERKFVFVFVFDFVLVNNNSTIRCELWKENIFANAAHDI